MVDAYENWREERPLERRSDERADGRLERRGPRRSEPRFEQRLDQWVSAGRQLVDGVSGARPGTRAGGRSSGLKLDHLGRWVEDKLDWLLEDDEGWRESWEQQPPQPRAQVRSELQSQPSTPRRSRRQPLQAISRRGLQAVVPPSASAAPPADAQDWPADESFALNRWQRGVADRRPAGEQQSAVAPQAGRAVPRSTRRRLDPG